MYLYKRRNRWWVEYVVDGVRHRVSTHATKKADAKFFADSIMAAKNAPTLEDAIAVLKTIYSQAPASRIAIEDIWTTYERIAKAVGKLSVTEKTLKDRKNRVAAFSRWLAKCAARIKSVEEVDGKIAILYAQHLTEDGAKTKTRKNIITDLSTVWKMLEKASGDVRNPWGNLTPADTDGERGEPFSRDQERAVFEAARKIGKDWFEICMVARHTGLRYGSCAFLEWADVHFDDGFIFTEPSKTKRFGIRVATPIVQPLMEVLLRIPRRGDYLFPTHAEMYDQNGGKDIMKFREVLDEAGISGSGYTFHSWRHTFRTRLAESGADIETAMRLCGHTQKETSRRYDHFGHLDEMRRAVEAAAE